MNENENISQLIFKSLEGIITEEERIQLTNWIAADAANKELFDELNSEDALAAAVAAYHPDIRLDAKNRIWGKIKEKSHPSKKSIVVPVRRLFFLRMAVAASVLLMIGIGTYFLFFNNNDKQVDIVKLPENSTDVKAPDNNRAIITLANGKKIYVDSIKSGQVLAEGNIKLVKLANGQIVYENVNGKIITEPVYNTIDNPKGSTVIDMTLADGSRVWLNAGSSLTYPVVFTGNERNVTITGEAYFEVAHNAFQPFKVKKGELEVTVLGTHFNVNAYDDEPNLKVTLLEGSVNVTNGTAAARLQPGQQTMLNNNGQLTPATVVNTDETIAWKEGLFHFESGDLKSILREFARWYNIQIVYEGPVKNRKFFAVVKRSSTLKSVLEMLQDNNIDYRIEGKKLIVKAG